MTHELPALPEQQYSQSHRRATSELLIETVTADRTQAQRRRPHHVVLMAVAVFAVLLAGTGAAVAYRYLGSAPVTDKNTARCYSKESTNFGSRFPGTTVAAVGTSGPGQPSLDGITAPVGLCAYLWGIGAVQGPGKPRTVPHLIGCVLPNGSAAVFPGNSDTCHRLGLSVAESG